MKWSFNESGDELRVTVEVTSDKKKRELVLQEYINSFLKEQGVDPAKVELVDAPAGKVKNYGSDGLMKGTWTFKRKKARKKTASTKKTASIKKTVPKV